MRIPRDFLFLLGGLLLLSLDSRAQTPAQPGEPPAQPANKPSTGVTVRGSTSHDNGLHNQSSSRRWAVASTSRAQLNAHHPPDQTAASPQPCFHVSGCAIHCQLLALAHR